MTTTHFNKTIDILCALHKEKSLLKNPLGYRYPVAVNRFVCKKEDKLLLQQTAENRIFPENKEYLTKIIGNRKVWNGKTLVLRGLEINKNQVVLKVSPGYYYDTLISSYRLKDELNIASQSHTDFNPHTFTHRFPTRYSLYQNIESQNVKRPSKNTSSSHNQSTREQSLHQTYHHEQLWDANGLSAALSISTAFFILDNNQYKLAYAKRSKHVAEDSGTYHLLPSMLLQPDLLQPKLLQTEPYLTTNAGYPVILAMVLQEINEEIFANTDSTTGKSAAVSDLKKLLHNNEAEFSITGIATDLTSMRPEIMTVLIVNNSQWFEKHRHSMNLCQFEFTKQTQNSLFHSFSTDKLFLPSSPFSPEQCVSTAAASLIEALNYVSSHHNSSKTQYTELTA